MVSGTLASKTIHELRALLDQGTIRPTDILEDLLARIQAVNPSIHAYLAIDPDRLR